MLFYQVSDDPPGQAAGMAEKCKTCGCNCGGQGAKYREQAEEIRKRMVYSSHRIEVMESEFLEIRENLEDELNDTAEELQSLKDKFYRLERSHKSLQRVNQDLEEKLLSMAAQSERTKASLNRDILEMTEKLMNTRLALNQLEESNDRYRKECNLAAQLLQCNPHNFVSPKFSSLPPELQERLQQHMEQVTKNHRKVKAAQSAPGAPADAVVPTAVLAEVLLKPHPVRTVRGVGARREKILFDACVQTNPEDIDQGHGKVIKAKPLRFTAYGVDMGNTRDIPKAAETGKPTGEWQPIKLAEDQAASTTSKDTLKVRAFMPISRGKDTGQNLDQTPRLTKDTQRPSAPAPQLTQSGNSEHEAQMQRPNVNGDFESQEGAGAKKVQSKVAGSSHTSPTKAKKKGADQASIGSTKGRAKKIGPTTEETEPLLDGATSDSTINVKREKIPSSQPKGLKSEADQTHSGNNRLKVKKTGPQGADGEETVPLLEKGAERNGEPGGKGNVKKVHPQTKIPREIKAESGSSFEITKGKTRKTLSVTEETEPLLERGENRNSEDDGTNDSVIHVKGKIPLSSPQATELSTAASRAMKTVSVAEESVPLLEDSNERAYELNDDSIVEVEEKGPSTSPQSKVVRQDQTAAVSVKVKKAVAETEEKPLIDLESNLDTRDKANGSDPSPQTEGPSLLSDSTEMKPEADQAPVDSATPKSSTGAAGADSKNSNLPLTKSPTSLDTKDAKPPSESTTPGTPQSGARPKSTVKKTSTTKVKKVTKTGAKKTGTKKKVKTPVISGEKQGKAKENSSPTQDKQSSSPTQERGGGSDEPESQQHLRKDNSSSVSKDNSNISKATQKCPPKDSQTSLGVHKDTEEENKVAESRQEGSRDKESIEGAPVSSQAEKDGMEEAPSEEDERAPRRRNSLEAAQLTGSLLDF
ncbi:uncharacterized protein LOC144871063 isoform X1 [Branchiostoma floridae x Branchiostoma japonicum]